MPPHQAPGEKMFSLSTAVTVTLLSSLFLYNDRVPVRLGNGFKHWHAHVTPEATANSHRESGCAFQAQTHQTLRRTFESAWFWNCVLLCQALSHRQKSVNWRAASWLKKHIAYLSCVRSCANEAPGPSDTMTEVEIMIVILLTGRCPVSDSASTHTQVWRVRSACSLLLYDDNGDKHREGQRPWIEQKAAIFQELFHATSDSEVTKDENTPAPFISAAVWTQCELFSASFSSTSYSLPRYRQWQTLSSRLETGAPLLLDTFEGIWK